MENICTIICFIRTLHQKQKQTDMKNLTKQQWFEVLDLFFTECLNFWKRELAEKGHDAIYVDMKSKQNALQDVVNTTTYPFAPKGIEIPVKIKFEWTLNK